MSGSSNASESGKPAPEQPVMETTKGPAAEGPAIEDDLAEIELAAGSSLQGAFDSLSILADIAAAELTFVEAACSTAELAQISGDDLGATGPLPGSSSSQPSVNAESGDSSVEDGSFNEFEEDENKTPEELVLSFYRYLRERERIGKQNAIRVTAKALKVRVKCVRKIINDNLKLEEQQ